jgi:NAD(P)H-hydrate epimerase
MKAITSKEMKIIDFRAINNYNINLFQMMELAGFHLTELTVKLFPKLIEEKKILILAGKGNNGGGGLSAARHLSNRGFLVEVILSQKKELKEAVLHHLTTLNKMGI